MKYCPACGETKPVEAFYKTSRSADGRQAYCTPCWKSKYHSPEYIRESALRRLYGISLKDYDELLASQNGHCAICPALPDTQRHGVLHVDHDHETQRVRGLLCDNCNNGLGRFQDNPNLLVNAAAYLIERGNNVQNTNKSTGVVL